MRTRLRLMSLTTVTSLLALLLLSGCTVNPVTGENQFSIISPSQEVALGTKNYQPSQQAQGGRYVVDPDLTAYVNRIGQQLAAVSDRPKLPYEFVVLNNSIPNAWALPGGKIAINRGLLLQLKDEAQLAAVLGHEIVHAAARHGATQMTQQVLLGAGAQAVAIGTKDSEYGQLATMGAQMGAAAWQARYGRDQELEADRYGMEYMVRAGYEPMAAVELQQTFVRLSQARQSNWLQGLFASHPPSQQRVDANRIRATQLKAVNPADKRNRSTFQRAIAQIKKDQPAYKAYDEAVAAVKNRDWSQAQSLVDKTTRLQPAEPLFWELKGFVHAKRGQQQQALTAYGKAIAANPEYFAGYLRRGLLQLERGSKQSAERDLLTSQKYLITQIASYRLGQLASEKGDKESATRYFQQVAQGGGELGQAAQQELAKLNPQAEQAQ